MTTLEFNTQLISMRRTLKSFARKLTTSDAFADDLVQDTFLKALNNKNKYLQYNGERNLKSWLITILKNTFINHYRKNKRTNYLEPEHDILENFGSADNKLNPETQMTLHELDDSINRLNKKFKEPIRLRLSGFKYHEIADMLNLNIGTVKSRIHLSKQKINKDLLVSP